jgi:DHA1 family multidrug resistance protein-like MFS transporter
MPQRTSSTPILFASLFIVMLGFGIVVPILPFYVTYFGASGRELGLMMAIYSLMQFICAPVWGRWSDRVGRKPVLLAGLVGFALSFGLMGLVQNVWQLIAARALAGILSSATLPATFAYIGDTTSGENRSGGMGILGAAMGLGMIFGPLLGGPLGNIALPLPFFAAAGFAVIAALFAFAMLPESLMQDKRVAHQAVESRASLLIGALRGPMAFLFVTAFLLAFALANFEAILGLFAKDRYALRPDQVGYLLGAFGFLGALQQGVIIGPLTKRIGEMRVLQSGLILSVMGLLGTALSANLWAFVFFSALFNFGNALLRPSVASLISQRATTGQGIAMGLENSFMSLGRAGGPLWAGFSYDVHMEYPFYSGALFQAIAFAISLVMMRESPSKRVIEASD